MMDIQSNNAYQRGCEEVSAVDILTLQEDIQSRKGTIHSELHIIAERCRYINNLLPISKLSGEILAEVFSYFATNPFSYNKSEVPVCGPYRWLHVTHVCHRWRNVALNSQRLWQLIYLGFPDRVREFLLRSGQAMLEVYPWSSSTSNICHFLDNRLTILPAEASVASLRLILAQAHRIQHVVLQLPDYTLQTALDTVDPDALTALKSIKMIDYGYDPLPDILSRNHLPALTDVELRGYQIPKRLSFLRCANNLTTLRIHPAPIPPTTPLYSCSLRDLLEVLSYTNKLETLEFLDSYCAYEDSELDDFHFAPLSFVKLPCLEVLKVHSAPTCVDTFLAQCTFPASTTINLGTVRGHVTGRGKNYVPDERTIDKVKSILSWLVHKLQEQPPITGFGLHFVQRSDMSEEMGRFLMTIATYHFDPSSISGFTEDELPLPNTVLRFECSHPCAGLSKFVGALLRDMQLEHVVYFQLGSPPSLYTSATVANEVGIASAALISRCSSSGLQALELFGSSYTILPHILTSWSNARSATHIHNDSSPTLFYSLRTLIFSQARRFLKMRGQSPPPEMGNWYDAIESQADLYVGTCGNFSKLILQRCTFYRDTSNELVDTIASIVSQRNRFTRDPPIVLYQRREPPQSHWTLPPPSTEEELPDVDLDWSNVFPQLHYPNPIPPAVMQQPMESTWVNHVRLGRITFDFRGSSGIQVEQNITPVMGTLGIYI